MRKGSPTKEQEKIILESMKSNKYSLANLRSLIKDALGIYEGTARQHIYRLVERGVVSERCGVYQAVYVDEPIASVAVSPKSLFSIGDTLKHKLTEFKGIVTAIALHENGDYWYAIKPTQIELGKQYQPFYWFDEIELVGLQCIENEIRIAIVKDVGHE